MGVVCFLGSDVGDEGVTELRGTEVPGTPSLMFGCKSRNPQRKCVTERRKKEPQEEKSVILMDTFTAWESRLAARPAHY